MAKFTNHLKKSRARKDQNAQEILYSKLGIEFLQKQIWELTENKNEMVEEYKKVLQNDIDSKNILFGLESKISDLEETGKVEEIRKEKTAVIQENEDYIQTMLALKKQS